VASVVVAAVEDFRRRRWRIVLGVCIGLGMGVASVSVGPWVYRSNVVVKVEGLCAHGCTPECDKCGTAPLPSGSEF
jgi:hypothetical protein